MNRTIARRIFHIVLILIAINVAITAPIALYSAAGHTATVYRYGLTYTRWAVPAWEPAIMWAVILTGAVATIATSIWWFTWEGNAAGEEG